MSDEHDFEEVEHPDEMPRSERAPELDAEALPALPKDTVLPRDAEVPEETKGA